MIKIELKRPIENPIENRAIMRIGVHNVSEEFLSHWFIQGLIQDGDIKVLSLIPSPAPLVKSSDLRVRESASFNRKQQPFKVEEINPKPKMENPYPELTEAVKATQVKSPVVVNIDTQPELGKEEVVKTKIIKRKRIKEE